MAAKTAAKAAAKKPAATKTAAAKKKAPVAKAEPKKAPKKAKKPAVVVESFDVQIGDAHAVLTINGDESRWSPDQVAALRRRVIVANVELH